jgi:hypothetical protein
MQGKVDPTVLFCGEAAIEAVAATSESKLSNALLLCFSTAGRYE